MTLSQDQMRTVLQEHVDAENDCDEARVMATYSRTDPEFEDVPAGRSYSGDDIVSENYQHLWDGFPGLNRRITRWTFGEDAAVIELTLSGKHDGPYRAVPATGKEIELRIIAHFQFDSEGRIAKETAYYDTLSFLRQLGLARE